MATMGHGILLIFNGGNVYNFHLNDVLIERYNFTRTVIVDDIIMHFSVSMDMSHDALPENFESLIESADSKVVANIDDKAITFDFVRLTNKDDYSISFSCQGFRLQDYGDFLTEMSKEMALPIAEEYVKADLLKKFNEELIEETKKLFNVYGIVTDNLIDWLRKAIDAGELRQEKISTMATMTESIRLWHNDICIVETRKFRDDLELEQNVFEYLRMFEHEKTLKGEESKPIVNKENKRKRKLMF